MPRTKKKIADTSLELSEKQLQYLQSDGATIEGLGVTTAEYNRWLKQPLFRILNELIDESVIEHDQIEDVLDEIKAAVLASQGFTYESIESRLDLYEGNLFRMDQLGERRRTLQGGCRTFRTRTTRNSRTRSPDS